MQLFKFDYRVMIRYSSRRALFPHLSAHSLQILNMCRAKLSKNTQQSVTPLLRSKIHNAPIPDPISCHFVEKNAIHHTHIALHIRYLSLDSGDGLGLLGRGGVEVLGTGDFRGRDGKDDLDVARVALVRVAKVPISVLVHLHFSLDSLEKRTFDRGHGKSSSWSWEPAERQCS